MDKIINNKYGLFDECNSCGGLRILHREDLRGRGIEKIIETMSLNNAKLIESLGQAKKDTILTKPKIPPVWNMISEQRDGGICK